MNPTVDSKATGVAGQGVRLGLGMKITLIGAAALMIATVLVTFSAALQQNNSMISAANRSNLQVTELVGTQITAAIRFKQKQAITTAFGKMLGDPASGLSNYLVLGQDGAEVTSAASESLPPADLTAFISSLDLANLGGIETTSDGNHLMIAIPVTFGPDNARVGTLAVGWSYATIRANVRGAVMTGIAVGAAILVAAILVLIYLTRRLISRPLSSITSDMRALQDGETDLPLSYITRTDEIGDMSKALQAFRDSHIERERLENESVETQRRRERQQNRIAELIAGFDAEVQQSLEAVGRNSEEMEGTAKVLSEIAENTSGKATSAAAASEQASCNVQTVASAAEELAASIEEIGRQVVETQKIVEEAAEATGTTNEKVSSLDASAQKIGEVVNLIQDIAEQTNLLALNATIEAARAGEMGKGFAVVASEVKELANQTSKATEEISSQISGIQGSTRDAVQAIDAITRTMNTVNEFTSTIAAAVQEQGAATADISQNVQQAAAGTRDVAHNMSGVTTAVSETSQSAEQVLSASQQVADQSDKLRATVSTFLENVRMTSEQEAA